MATYSPCGKAHRVLECLAQSDASMDVLALHLGVPTRTDKRDRLWWLLGSLLADRLIGGRRGRYWLTEDGKDALVALRAGQNAVTTHTSIRRFG